MSIIRRAEDKDTKAIMNLLVQVNMVHHNGRPDLFNGPKTKYTEDQLHEMFLDDRNPIFVYEDDNGNVRAHMFTNFKQILNDNIMTDIKTLYIDDLCVDETARGQHIGSKMYDFIKGFARENGCYNVTLNVWECNVNAKKFYESQGLKVQKTGMEEILT